MVTETLAFLLDSGLKEKMRNESDNKMIILTNYVQDADYGLLGPQMAADIIEANTPFHCVVLGIVRTDAFPEIKKALYDYFGQHRPVIGFSTLGGREDLFRLAGELKDEGAGVILAGPQAGADFSGETGHDRYPHRFQGVSGNFDFALQGPAEQILKWLQGGAREAPEDIPGAVFRNASGDICKNNPKPWEAGYLKGAKWNNLFRLKGSSLIQVNMATAQVVQQIGCPHAAKNSSLFIDYPVFMKKPGNSKLAIRASGCAFCDVAADKGFLGRIEQKAVLEQISRLPENEDGQKIPFELINENPLPQLPGLLDDLDERGFNVSRIDLTMRADWFLKGIGALRKALGKAEKKGTAILLSSMGFESFDDRILKNLNKGTTAAINIEAIRQVRILKRDFPNTWYYSREDGGCHGIIHPTPWDCLESEIQIKKIISMYNLGVDILPEHSTPLIIHHASSLAAWIRMIEEQEILQFPRHGSIIGWWEASNGEIE